MLTLKPWNDMVLDLGLWIQMNVVGDFQFVTRFDYCGYLLLLLLSRY